MCAAITRWVQYDPTASGSSGDGDGQKCLGTAGHTIGIASVDDTMTIGPTTNQLQLEFDGANTGTITLYSGSNLDPRFIAKDITEKMHAYGIASKAGDETWTKAVCKWENAWADNPSVQTYGNRFKIYSGTLGSSSSATVTSGSASTILGFDTLKSQGGAPPASSDFEATISGTYQGFIAETYKVVITADGTRGIGTPTIKVGNTYNGVMTTGGVFNHTSDILYTISIQTAGVGSTMGGGTGNVPVMSWTSTGSVDDSTPNDTELLYVDHWYAVGTKGLMVKFSDAVFADVTPAWDIQCTAHLFAESTNNTAALGSAEYVYSSDRGDDSTSTTVTVSGGYTRVGSRGLYIKLSDATSGNVLTARDEFTILCSGPQPLAYNVTSLNYGNVTVSTESPVKTVMFEVESGAVEISTVKFGLESHGSFLHHVTNDNETFFRFGSGGVRYPGGSGDENGVEWHPNIIAGDLSGGTSYLNATEANLSEVSSADASEVVGSWGLFSDPIWLCIKLGSSETGANSSINHRLYFDYS